MNSQINASLLAFNKESVGYDLSTHGTAGEIKFYPPWENAYPPEVVLRDHDFDTYCRSERTDS